MNPRPPLKLLRDPAILLASGFGCGYAPFAPGTVGSAVAILPYLALRQADPWWLWAATALLFFAGVRTAGHVIRVLGREDPPLVTLDEWVGQWMALGLIELAIRFAPEAFGTPPLWLVLVVGFAAFRACDIVKPWPASWADAHVSGGLGAMLDDAFAGVWAGALGALLLWGLAAL